MKRARAWMAALLALSLPAQGFAAFMEVGDGARPAGFGGAFTAVADDVHAAFYNPAGLGTVERPQLLASHALMHMGLEDGSRIGNSHLAFAYPWREGRRGTFAAGWQRLSLDSLYAESRLQLSYGRLVRGTSRGKGLFLGATAKQLSRSFGTPAEATNALNNLTATGQADPLLAKVDGQSALEADFGLLYRFHNRYAIGFAAQNMVGSDWAVGANGQDKLERSMRLGVSNKSLWMTVAGEAKMEKGGTGETDTDFTVAAERIFPTLDKGQFGLRGAVTLGSRDRREVATGLSYRVNKIQFDYAFALPVGGLQGTAGTHRIGMLLLFGAPTPEERFADQLLDQIARLGGKGKGDEFMNLKNPADLDDPRFTEIRELLRLRQYRKAYRRLTELAAEFADESLLRTTKRVGLVAGFFPELGEPGVSEEVALDRGIKKFIEGADRDAMLQTAYAHSLDPDDVSVDRFLARLEEATGIKADRVEPESGMTLVDLRFVETEKLHREGRNRAALSKMEDVMQLEPDSVRAMERLGSAHYALGNLKEAVALWERALPKENDALERQALSRYIKNTRDKLQAQGVTLPPPASALEPTRRGAAGETTDYRTIEKLYEAGVEAYARGQRLKARVTFERILRLDPENTQAKKALDRIRLSEAAP